MALLWDFTNYSFVLLDYLAVAEAGGVIKVVSNQEGASVVITANGKTVSTKAITNGEVLFSDLSTNSYIVTIGNEWKLINIVLKQK